MSEISEVEAPQPKLTWRSLILSLVIIVLVIVVVACAAPAAGNVYSNIVSAL